MKRFALTFLLLALLCIAASAQTDRAVRVKFPRGRTTTILKGSLKGDEITRYVFQARAGQTMIVHLTSPSARAQFDVYLRGERGIFRDGEDVTDFQGTLPRDGDYIVSVYGLKPRATYTLEVTIR
jgi:hypothetical protein